MIKRKAKVPPVVNLQAAMEVVSDLLAQVCQCGHTESDHFMDKNLKAVNCGDCACPKFMVAFGLAPYKESRPQTKKRKARKR